MARRALSVDAILRRRAAEDAALRGAVAAIDAEIAVLATKRAALERALTFAPPLVVIPPAQPAGPQTMVCFDCNARVSVTSETSACPACDAEPFEGC